MLIKLTGGKVYDPANKVSGEVRDIYVEDGKIVAPRPNAKPDATYDVKGRVVMAGAIDPHTHIGGGKMTIARALLPEDHRGDPVTRTDRVARGGAVALEFTPRTDLFANREYVREGIAKALAPFLPAPPPGRRPMRSSPRGSRLSSPGHDAEAVRAPRCGRRAGRVRRRSASA